MYVCMCVCIHEVVCSHHMLSKRLLVMYVYTIYIYIMSRHLHELKFFKVYVHTRTVMFAPPIEEIEGVVEGGDSDTQELKDFSPLPLPLPDTHDKISDKEEEEGKGKGDGGKGGGVVVVVGGDERQEEEEEEAKPEQEKPNLVMPNKVPAGINEVFLL